MAEEERIALLAPTRFSALPPWAARGVLLLLLALIAYGVGLTESGPLIEHMGHGADAALYGEIAHDMRQGLDYYQAAETQLRARGYAMTSVFNWRMPTLAWIFAALPSDKAARGLLATLSLLTLAAWFAALRRTMPPRTAFLACVVLLGLFAWPFVGEAYRVHETWAGIAIALSIAAAVLDWKMVCLFSGLAALAIRELALVHTVVALLLALRGRRPREALGWLAGIALFSACWMLHARGVAHHQLASDIGQATGWLTLGGWRFVLKTAVTNFWLILAPSSLVAILWPLSLVGLGAWRNRIGGHVAATILAYVGLFLFAGLPYNYLWGLLYAGLVPLGLLPAPAAIRDLWRRSFSRTTGS